MQEEQTSSTNVIMAFFEWLMILAYLNLLWFFFTLKGFIVFGIGPATLALFGLIRKKLRQGDLAYIYQNFKREVDEHKTFGRPFSWLTLGVALFLYVDMMVVRALPVSELIQMGVIPALIVVSGLTVIVSTFTIGIRLEFKEDLVPAIKKGFWVTLISPITVVVILHAFLIQWLLLSYIPALFPFYSISLFAFLSQWIMTKAFRRMKNKKKSI
ncbi:YesL family protein [Alkalibacterium iburiense]|uniref:YesL family protein n=1 Tax=Alkalibacterium iburiense TaxID=290589 RepID=A0ABP3GZ94_9LACT